MPAVPRLNFRLPKPKARYPRFPNVRTTTRERGNDFQIYTDGGTRVVDGETFAGWGAFARCPNERMVIMIGPVVTTQAHLAFSGDRSHTNNTGEMSAMIEALSFLGPFGPLARDAISCIFYDSKHAAGLCLGTIQARTRVQLALACQRSTPCAQHRLRLAMQHVYGHSGNLGNECADHAAALGTLGLVSSHNLATRWGRHNFDTSACFGTCNNTGEVLENYVTLKLKLRRYLTAGVSACFLSGPLRFSRTHCIAFGFTLSLFSRAQPFYCTLWHLK